MINEIIADLTTELQITEGERFNSTLLESKVKNAYREVMTEMRYPKSFSDAYIENDMRSNYSNVRAIALFDYNQVGAEGQTQYSQDGVSVHYVDRNKLFHGIIPYAKRG